MRLQPLAKGTANVLQHGRLKLDNHRRVVAHQQLDEREVRLPHLWEGHNLFEAHGEAQLDRHRQAVGQRTVSIQRKHAEVDVVSRERARQQQEADGDSLVTVGVRIGARRRLVLENS